MRCILIITVYLVSGCSASNDNNIAESSDSTKKSDSETEKSTDDTGADAYTDSDTDIDTDIDEDSDTDTDNDTDTDSDNDTDSDTDIDINTEKDTNTDTDVDNSSDTDLYMGWSLERVDQNNVGLHAQLDTGPEDELSIAYFSNLPFSDGLCTELDHAPFPTRNRFDLKFATKTNGGDWQIETVDSPLHPTIPGGLGFKYTPDGEPAIAYTGGEPELDYCGANDAFYVVKLEDNWTTETASSESGDSQTGDEASDTGFGVGWFPAMAFDPNGEPFIVHRDQHFVYLQRDDTFRADLELAWRVDGSWNHEAIDYGDGAGAGNEIIFDASGNPLVFTYIPAESHGSSREGVWAYRRNNEGLWEQTKIHTGAIGHGISADLDPVFNEPVVAFYSVPDFGVKVRRLVNNAQFTEPESWTSEIVKDSRYDEGDYVSLAFSPLGELALSYHRCKLYGISTESCDPSVETLIFAYQREGHWYFEKVMDGDGISCGTYTSLAFSQNGTAHIALQCGEELSGEFVFSLFVASKKM